MTEKRKLCLFLKGENLKKFTIRIILFVFIFYILPFGLAQGGHSIFYNPAALAAESSSSADQNDSQESIQTKLEELKIEIASKAAKIKQEIDRKLKDKAYVGKVKSFSETSVTLAAGSGPKMVSINQDTVFENKKPTSKSSKNKKVFSAKQLAEDDYIAALGDSDETGVLIAKKIILLPDSNYQPKIPLWGQIISTGEKLITLRDKDFKNIAVSILTSAKVKLNDFVILAGNIDKNEIFEASFIYIVPQGGIIKPKRITTPSAQTATPSSKSTTASGKPKPTTR